MRVYVENRGGRAGMSPEARTVRGPMAIVDWELDETFPAPVTSPGAFVTMQRWRGTSRDNLWFFERSEGEGSPWSVKYLPTGQIRDGYGNDEDAREAAAGHLLPELRGEAVLAAFDMDSSAEQRREGQRWLAVHVRIAGGTDVDSGCVCGGLLAQARRDGAMGNVDACEACRPIGALPITSPCPVIEDGGAHSFCANPQPALTVAEQRMLQFESRMWKRAGAKETAIREQFGLKPMRYYQVLRQLLRRREAVAFDPITVRRLGQLLTVRTPD